MREKLIRHINQIGQEQIAKTEPQLPDAPKSSSENAQKEDGRLDGDQTATVAHDGAENQIDSNQQQPKNEDEQNDEMKVGESDQDEKQEAGEGENKGQRNEDDEDVLEFYDPAAEARQR